MKLGAFSISLAVKDLAASRAFYEAFGFAAAGGDPAQGWLIMRNGDAVIGLFQGMFEKNMLTFNPGWDQQCGDRYSKDPDKLDLHGRRSTDDLQSDTPGKRPGESTSIIRVERDIERTNRARALINSPVHDSAKRRERRLRWSTRSYECGKRSRYRPPACQ